ncbi:MAG: hypothetical protein HON70_29245, partial [Lentisphaerae bacterium]|nr:hypothetical protein [Lentisphaerota bacterium]
LLISGSIIWAKWGKTLVFPIAQAPLQPAAVLTLFFLVGVVIGSYYIGSSRESGCRWLRPCGAWLFLTALCYLGAALALLGEHVGWMADRLDIGIAKILLACMLVLGAEALTSFVIEFYRPRSPGEELRPLFESRLLALFTEPGGIARNVASSLDYQFGFHVSEVWFYRFVERTVAPFAAVMIAALWLQTCFVVVRTEENAIRERFGRVVSQAPLAPGLYLKLPAPFARIYKFPVERLQLVHVGYIPSGGEKDKDHAGHDEPAPGMEDIQGDPSGRVMVWSKTHHREEFPFIVASRPEAGVDSAETTDPTDEQPVSAYFLAASVPVYFRVSNLYDYAYRHATPKKALEKIASKELVKYLANVDFFRILTSGRAQGAQLLRERIQQAVGPEGAALGIEIVFVGLQGLHPPVYVGEAFDEVVGAMEEKHELILKGETYQIQRQPAAEAAALALVTQAQGYQFERVQVSQAEAERFGKQMLAFDASPNLFVLRSFLDVLENEGRNVRKYVIGTETSDETFVLDLEEKLRPDLLDLDLERSQQ